MVNKKRVRKSIIYKRCRVVGLEQEKTARKAPKRRIKSGGQGHHNAEKNLGSDDLDTGVRRVIGSTDIVDQMLFGTVLFV